MRPTLNGQGARPHRSGETSVCQYRKSSEFSAVRSALPPSHGRLAVSARRLRSRRLLIMKVAQKPRQTRGATMRALALLAATAVCRLLTSTPSSGGREGHVDLVDDASASSVRHHIGEPYASKDQ